MILFLVYLGVRHFVALEFRRHFVVLEFRVYAEITLQKKKQKNSSFNSVSNNSFATLIQ